MRRSGRAERNRCWLLGPRHPLEADLRWRAERGEPDVVHLPLPISKKGSANTLTPTDRAIAHRRLISTPCSSRARGWVSSPTPPRHTPLESSRHLKTEVDGEAGLTSRPMYAYRGHSFRPGSPCPRTSPTVPCCQGLQLRWCRCPGARLV